MFTKLIYAIRLFCEGIKREAMRLMDIKDRYFRSMKLLQMPYL
jgi:hypothetical protein